MTDLELRSINDIATSLSNISKSYNERIDSVQDFICDQFNIETDEPEVLKQVRGHFEVMVSNLEDVTSEFKLLKDHLMQSK